MNKFVLIFVPCVVIVVLTLVGSGLIAALFGNEVLRLVSILIFVFSLLILIRFRRHWKNALEEVKKG
ncbi:hypothetical protein ACFWGC_26645 [Cytobacillus pseudoceanisediminis]|uniref:hypothetical protein n=1 Tax=Cytobacillus pseudoceanisediminis TaxID=3051614 RepID=UPI0036491FBF